jgi:uncharacterized protein DUF6298/collagenase-like protein with putative collagen-binding domain
MANVWGELIDELGQTVGRVLQLLALLGVAGLLAVALAELFGADSTPKSMGPLRKLASNPRYFTINGKRPVYLTGSHVFWNLVDNGPTTPPPAFDYADYLSKLQAMGHNFTRFWTRENFRDDDSGGAGLWNSAPLPFLRTGPGNAFDGQPKFDLTRMNQTYFDRLRRRVVAAREKGIYVSIMLFEGWVVQLASQPWAWEGHPMHPSNNVNGIDGDLNDDGRGTEIHTLENPEITRLQEAYVRKVIDTVNDLDNVLYEIGNEIGPYSTDFQYHFVRFVKGYEAKKRLQHPVGMTFQWVGGSNDTLFASPADWVSTRDPIDQPPVHPRTKVVISDSDHHCGSLCVSGDWVWRAFTRGHNPIFHDAWGRFRGARWDDPWQLSARAAMGQTRSQAKRVDLAAMEPRPELASTGFCLASEGDEYIVYQPSAGEPFEIDLSPAAGKSFAVTWLEVPSGARRAAARIAGGGKVTLTPPSAEPAVAYLKSV